MVVQFDKFKRWEKPLFYVCNPGCVYSNGTLTNVAGILADTSDEELILRFNTTSELNFRVHRVVRDDAEENEHVYRLYKSLRNRRVIFVDGVGFFIIRNVEDGYENGISYKDISADSCESELQSKNVPYIENGTYQFFNNSTESPGIINKVLQSCPGWALNYIDPMLLEKYRTFEDVSVDTNVLGFMLEDIQDAYECLFVFDITNRLISVFDQANYTGDADVQTNIHITKDDFISSLNVTESSDELYTAMSVYGADDLSLNAINPIGTSVIYNFDYYLDWMSSGLASKVIAWQRAVDNAMDVGTTPPSYFDLQLSYYSLLTTLSTLNADKENLQIQLDTYRKCRDNCVAESSDDDIDAYNEIIEHAGGVPLSTTAGYTWVKFAKDDEGTDMSDNPLGRNYIGIAYDKASGLESANPLDYSWSTYKSASGIPRTQGGLTTYTWVKFAETTSTGMSDLPDDKSYLGISVGNASSSESIIYTDYTWRFISDASTGVPNIIAEITNKIANVNSALIAKQAEIDVVQAEADDLLEQINAIRASLAMNRYFTSSELAELDNYIYQGSYTDDYIIVTDSMDSSQRLTQMKLLYDRSKAQLEKIAFPTQEFDVDVNNFIFVKDFEEWSEQLKTGCLINVELDDDDVASLFLTEISVNYDDKSLKMTFGNRFNRFDPKALFEDTLGKISRTANTLSYIRDTVYPLRSGEFNEMKNALSTSRTLSKTDAMTSRNEQVIIDDTGYTGRRKLPDGTTDPKQIKINGRNIVFTDDAWETCKTAIGELVLANGSAYGINAEVLLGNIIMGNEMHIINKDGEDMFKVTEEGIKAYVAEEYAAKEDTISGVSVEYAQSSSRTTPPQTGWSPVAPEWQSGLYMWQRTKTLFDDGSSVISDPTCISGADGQSGTSSNSAIAYLYKRSSAQPSIDWTQSLTYSFDDKTITSPAPSGWSKTIPSGNNPLYVTAATAYGSEATDSISASEWSAPVMLAKDGQDGQPGQDGSDGLNVATINIYKRSSSTPAKPSSTLTYTFGTGVLSGDLDGWSQGVPAINGDPCYSIQATAASTTATDTILASEWNAQRVIVEDGEDGVSVDSIEAEYYLSLRPGYYYICDGTESTDYQYYLEIGSDKYQFGLPAVSSGDLLYYDDENNKLFIGGPEGDNIVISEYTDSTHKLIFSHYDYIGGEWSSETPSWQNGKYIWTRSHMYLDDGTETFTDPVLNNYFNDTSSNIAQNTKLISDVAVSVSGVTSTVAQIQPAIQDAKAGVANAMTRIAELNQTSQALSVNIQTIMDNGVDQVTTETGYTFNSDGLKITKSGEEMENKLDNTGMYVIRKTGEDEENMLVANNEGVIATDVKVRNFLIVGHYARFQDYGASEETSVNPHRTGCFHIELSDE